MRALAVALVLALVPCGAADAHRRHHHGSRCTGGFPYVRGDASTGGVAVPAGWRC